MPELNKMELELVSGGVGVCTPGSNIGSVTSSGMDTDFSLYYYALVAAASRAIIALR